jgi:hypothetical protein
MTDDTPQPIMLSNRIEQESQATMPMSKLKIRPAKSQAFRFGDHGSRRVCLPRNDGTLFPHPHGSKAPGRGRPQLILNRVDTIKDQSY